MWFGPRARQSRRGRWCCDRAANASVSRMRRRGWPCKQSLTWSSWSIYSIAWSMWPVGKNSCRAPESRRPGGERPLLAVVHAADPTVERNRYMEQSHRLGPTLGDLTRAHARMEQALAMLLRVGRKRFGEPDPATL